MNNKAGSNANAQMSAAHQQLNNSQHVHPSTAAGSGQHRKSQK